MVSRLSLCGASLLLIGALLMQDAGASGLVQQPPPGTGDEQAALMAEGEALFGTSCSSCHSDPGMESIGPTLGGDAALASKDHVIGRILQGAPEKGMPPFARSFSDRQVAAVATYIRNAWENAYGIVTEAEVAKVRESVAKK